jgi:hypothetical protein
MLAYQVYTEQEANEERYQLLKEGEYDAVISASQDKTSANKGNPMMDMILCVFDKDGKSKQVRDFIVFTKTMMWRVIHFAESAGLMKEYEEGKLRSDVAIDCRVRVKIAVEKGGEIPQDKLKGKPMGSKYPDKNTVEDYLKKDLSLEDENPLDDDVPF